MQFIQLFQRELQILAFDSHTRLEEIGKCLLSLAT